MLVQERDVPGRAGTSGGRGFIGAYMATNERGHPLEFRITTPVRPSGVQRAIYGDDLHAYVSAELIARTLRREAAQPVECLFLHQDMEPFADDHGVPVVRLHLAEAARILAPGMTEGRIVVRDRIIHYETFPAAAARAHDLLALCAAHFDPGGAFTRMATAIDVLLTEDERFR